MIQTTADMLVKASLGMNSHLHLARKPGLFAQPINAVARDLYPVFMTALVGLIKNTQTVDKLNVAIFAVVSLNPDRLR